MRSETWHGRVYFGVLIVVCLIFVVYVVANSLHSPSDINCDGKVNSTDLAIVYAVSQGKTATDDMIRRCDVTGDGLVDDKDLQLVMDKILEGGRND